MSLEHTLAVALYESVRLGIVRLASATLHTYNCFPVGSLKEPLPPMCSKCATNGRQADLLRAACLRRTSRRPEQAADLLREVARAERLITYVQLHRISLEQTSMLRSDV